MPRVLAADFKHETNTFCKRPTDVAAFEAMFVVFGDEIPARFGDTNYEIAGFYDVGKEQGWELTPVVVAAANPSGKVTDDAFARLGGAIVTAAREQGPFDGIALSLHGAMVTDSFEDAEGELLGQLRDAVGPEVPIAVTLDLHANVTEAMAERANILVSYKTYPHVDMRDRGRDAARLLDAAMRGVLRPRTLRIQPPTVEGVNWGRSDEGPMVELQRRIRAYESEPGILCISVNAGFQLADIRDVGPSVTVTYDSTAEARARAIAEEIASEIWRTRDVVTNVFLTPEEAAELAKSFDGQGKPLVIADFADNPGAGTYGDAPALLAAMIEADLRNACFGAIYDPGSAAALVKAGVGATATVALGGKSDPAFGGPPLEVTGEVMTVTDGRFVCEGPMFAGIEKSFGPTAVLRVGGIDVMVTSRNMQILDRQMFVAQGIVPEEKAVVALKSMQHFRAAYEPLAAKVVVCDAGGLARQPATLTFKNARRPIYPFDPVSFP